MKPVTKWILGFALLAVLAAVVAGAVWAWRSMPARESSTPVERAPASEQLRPPDGRHGGPAHGPGSERALLPDGHGGPPMMPFGAVFFLPFGLLQLIPLVLVALLVVGAYQMGKRAGAKSASSPVAT